MNSDLEGIVRQYAIRHTPALDRIADALGFQDKDQYEVAVRKLLIDDSDALEFVRKLFGDVVSELI